METYEKLLEKAYKTVKLVEKGTDRFEIPKVEGHVTGNSTFITNFGNIVSYLRREPAHLAKFLQKELAVYAAISDSRLIFKAKIGSDKVNDKIQKYSKEFVICPVCGKPDTELISEKGIKYKHCLACGAKSPTKYNL